MKRPHCWLAPGDKPIALVGLRCAGKTSVGRELAKLLGVEFVDLDDVLPDPTDADWLHHGFRHASAGELLAELDEVGFRELERRALVRVLGRADPFVLATGGGVVEREDNRELLRRAARCVWLREPIEVLQRRLAADPTPRPALAGPDPVSEVPHIASRREPLYREVAVLTVDGLGESPSAIAARLALRLAAGQEP